MLHSQTLEFLHPMNEKRFFFTSELPEDFMACLDFLENVNLPLKYTDRLLRNHAIVFLLLVPLRIRSLS